MSGHDHSCSCSIACTDRLRFWLKSGYGRAPCRVTCLASGKSRGWKLCLHLVAVFCSL